MTDLQCLKCKNISECWETDFEKKEKSSMILTPECLALLLYSPRGQKILKDRGESATYESIDYSTYIDIIKDCKTIKKFYSICTLPEISEQRMYNYFMKERIKEDIFDFYNLNEIQQTILNQLSSLHEGKEQFLAYTNITNKNKILAKLHYLFH